MKKGFVILLAGALALSAAPRRRAITPPSSGSDASIVFTFDSGFRVVGATNPAAGVDPATGEVYLYYTDNATGRQMRTIAADGLTFSSSAVATSWRLDPRNTLMPDGKTWRRYQWDMQAGRMRSVLSNDGVNFLEESGTRYTPQPNDHGTLGVYDAFSDHAGGVVLLYIGDLPGLNNVRRAYSRDNGLTFTYERGNILGDDNAGGGPNSYVDEKTMRLPDGRIRLFTMKQNVIYSFISYDDGATFSIEPGARLAPASFTGATLRSLNDPSTVRLNDGRYRMYVASLRSDNVWVIVSATTK